MNDDTKFWYAMGQRDTLAGILATYKDKIKLPEIAKDYEKAYQEKHFSHNWHVE